MGRIGVLYLNGFWIDFSAILDHGADGILGENRNKENKGERIERKRTSQRATKVEFLASLQMNHELFKHLPLVRMIK